MNWSQSLLLRTLVWRGYLLIHCRLFQHVLEPKCRSYLPPFHIIFCINVDLLQNWIVWINDFQGFQTWKWIGADNEVSIDILAICIEKRANLAHDSHKNGWKDYYEISYLDQMSSNLRSLLYNILIFWPQKGILGGALMEVIYII